MPDPAALRARLVQVAHRHSRVAHEVEDLAHDLVVAALGRGLPLDESLLHMAHGAARRHGAFLARSAVRRRARDARAAELHLWEAGDGLPDPPRSGEVLPPGLLSRSLSTTLLLLLLGLEKHELRARSTSVTMLCASAFRSYGRAPR